MSDTHDDDDLIAALEAKGYIVSQDDGQPKKPGVRQRMKDLEDENKLLKEQASTGTDAQRKLAFLEAGFNAEDLKGRAKYFVKAYDGDLSAEAIKAEAVDVGLLALQQTTPPDAQQSHQRMLAAAAGGEKPPSAQWTEAEVVAASPAQVEAAEQAGLLQEYLGLPT